MTVPVMISHDIDTKNNKNDKDNTNINNHADNNKQYK